MGHSLENDFKAMKFVHPWVSDTTLLYPLELGLPMKRRLRKLVKTHLGEDMDRRYGHNSFDDAKRAMQLVLHRVKHGPFAQGQGNLMREDLRSMGSLSNYFETSLYAHPSLLLPRLPCEM